MIQSELGRTPAVFVSSTCYDLKQVRNDIRQFINNDLGYEAILSEFDSFPLDPEMSSVENCIRAVKQRADIFCLIIGGRYGSTADNGKSVTNLEYINAKAKGIPTYVFIDKAILSILPLWETNPNADFSTIVDNSKLFEFVSTIRNKENVWVYGFENAQDIIRVLRKQLSYLFYDSLKIRGKINSNKFNKKLQQLEGNTLKIIIEKPSGWEYLLLGEILEQSLNRNIELKMDFLYGLSFGNVKKITEFKDFLNFLFLKIHGLQQIVENLNILFSNAIPDAIGAPGEPGNEEKIIYVGEKFGSVYESLLIWGLEFNTISVEEDWNGLIKAVSKMCKSPIEDLDDYMNKYKNGMKKIIQHIDYKTAEKSDEPETLDLSLIIKSPNLEDYQFELKKLGKIMGI